MATPDPAEAEHALAICICINRDLMRDDLETVADRHGMTIAKLMGALAWWRRAEPFYRGTPIMDRAEAAATRMRRNRRPQTAAAERRLYLAAPSGDDELMHLDRPDLSRPERPCNACGETFQPTRRRRILCARCFRDEGAAAANSILSVADRATIGKHATKIAARRWIDHGDGAKPSRTR